MKKLIALILASVLILGIAIPACASGYTMYVNKDKVKAYEQPDSGSKVVKKLKGGTAVLLNDDMLVGSDYVSILLEDTKHGGQIEAFVLAKYLSDTMPQKYCKHEWGEWHTIEEPTCTESGKREHTCEICGLTKSEKLKKLGHTYGPWEITKEATCYKEGTRERTCEVCGHVDKENYLDEHTYGDWVVTQKPTCSAPGARERTCELCGYVDEQVLDPLPHEYEWQIVVEATDHSQGVRAKICAVCGYNGGEESFDPEGTLRRQDRGEEVRQLQQQLVDQGYLSAGGADGIFGDSTEKAVISFQTAQGLDPDGVAWPQTIKRLSHNFGPWETVRAMTRTEPGERQRTCVDCGYVQTEAIEPGEVIERGARGDNIRALQQILKQMGCDAGSFDGIYGKKLDSAFTQFDAAHGLSFEAGRVRPADVDALVSAWLEANAESIAASTEDSPVNLALSVTPSADELSDGEVTTYEWTVTNLGTENCMFNAVLLTYGAAPDFSRDDLVMVIDGEELTANAANFLSGSFKVAKAWGEGNLNFAAMAVSEQTGTKWLSNVVAYEDAEANAPRTVEPLPVDLDVSNLPDGVYPVSFDPGDIARVNSGTYMNAVHIYTMDTYDGEALRSLKEGDTVLFGEDAIDVREVEFDGDSVVVNGTALIPTGDGDTYRLLLYDDIATYTDHGVATLMLDPSAVYVDSSDPEKGEVTADYDGLLDAIQASGNNDFNKFNTTVKIEGGKVAEIDRVYVP